MGNYERQVKLWRITGKKKGGSSSVVCSQEIDFPPFLSWGLQNLDFCYLHNDVGKWGYSSSLSISMTTAADARYKEIRLAPFTFWSSSSFTWPSHSIDYTTVYTNKRPNVIQLIGLQNSKRYHWRAETEVEDNYREREKGKGIQQIQQPTHTAGCKAKIDGRWSETRE